MSQLPQLLEKLLSRRREFCKIMLAGILKSCLLSPSSEFLFNVLKGNLSSILSVLFQLSKLRCISSEFSLETVLVFKPNINGLFLTFSITVSMASSRSKLYLLPNFFIIAEFEYCLRSDRSVSLTSVVSSPLILVAKESYGVSTANCTLLGLKVGAFFILIFATSFISAFFSLSSESRACEISLESPW